MGDLFQDCAVILVGRDSLVNIKKYSPSMLLGLPNLAIRSKVMQVQVLIRLLGCVSHWLCQVDLHLGPKILSQSSWLKTCF